MNESSLSAAERAELLGRVAQITRFHDHERREEAWQELFAYVARLRASATPDRETIARALAMAEGLTERKIGIRCSDGDTSLNRASEALAIHGEKAHLSRAPLAPLDDGPIVYAVGYAPAEPVQRYIRELTAELDELRNLNIRISDANLVVELAEALVEIDVLREELGCATAACGKGAQARVPLERAADTTTEEG